MAESKCIMETKVLLDLISHCQAQLEKSFSLLAQYKDSENLKKLIMVNVEAYSTLLKDLITMMSIVTARNLNIDLGGEEGTPTNTTSVTSKKS